MKWEIAPTEDPLKTNYLTHEDRMYADFRWGLFCYTAHGGLAVVDKKTWSTPTDERMQVMMQKDLDAGNPYALKLFREIVRAKMVGGWVVVNSSEVA